MRTAQLKDLKRGDHFFIADLEFVIQEQHQEMAEADAPAGYSFVEALKPVAKMPFDEGGNNDWRFSSLRKWLNGPWLDELEAKAPEVREYMVHFERDLTADDGLKDYGTCIDKVSLLTADEYRANRDLHMDPPEGWRWLITPDSTPSGGGTSFARSVNSDGTLSYDYAYDGIGGVLPALYLKSGLSVSTEDDEEDEDEDLTPEQKEMALYEAAVEKFGERAQILVAVEEMSELTKALLKYIRNQDHGQGDREKILENIQEERADVSIMLNQLQVIFGDNSEAEVQKLEHLEALVGGDAGKEGVKCE